MQTVSYTHLDVYKRQLRALQQKNALLRRAPAGQERPYAEKMALLEVLNTELAAQGEAIQQRRRAYLERLAPLACANYEELSHGAERMELRYAAQFEPGGLAVLLKARQNEEVRAGQSLCGPHREDLELLLDGQPARVFASQGQQRSEMCIRDRAYSRRRLFISLAEIFFSTTSPVFSSVTLMVVLFTPRFCSFLRAAISAATSAFIFSGS